MALYKNITDKSAYVLSNMTKMLIKPGQIVEITSRDLIHVGMAISSFESVAKAKEVEDKKMAAIARAKKFAPAVPAVPIEVKPEPVAEIVPEIVVAKKYNKKEKLAKPEAYEVSREAIVAEIETDLAKEIPLVQEVVEPVAEAEAQTI